MAARQRRISLKLSVAHEEKARLAQGFLFGRGAGYMTLRTSCRKLSMPDFSFSPLAANS